MNIRLERAAKRTGLARRLNVRLERAAKRKAGT